MATVAPLVCPRTTFFVTLKSPVGVTDTELEVENVKVFCVISSTIKVSLNSLCASSAPLNTTRSPELIP